MPIEKKVIFAGLQNAGKTSILRALDREFAKLEEISPTKGVEYSQFELLGTIIARWDMGGQNIYRERYMADIRKYFMDVGLIVYVIDVQEHSPSAQADAISYLRGVLDAVKALDLDPVVAIFMHKHDPTVLEDPHIQEHLKVYIDAIQMLRNEYTYRFWYYPTSIKDPVELVRAFSHAMLQFLDQKTLLKEELWEAAGKLGATLLYLVEQSGYILGTSNPEGVPDDLQHAVEKWLYDHVPELPVPSQSTTTPLTDLEELIVIQMLVQEHPYYLAAVWPTGTGKKYLMEHAVELTQVKNALGKVIKILLPNA